MSIPVAVFIGYFLVVFAIGWLSLRRTRDEALRRPRGSQDAIGRRDPCARTAGMVAQTPEFRSLGIDQDDGRKAFNVVALRELSVFASLIELAE